MAAGRSQFVAVEDDFDGLKTVSELVASLKSAVEDAEDALASREDRFKCEIEGKEKEIEKLQIEKLGLENECGELKELASRLREERDNICNRSKEKEVDQDEIIELKKINCELECEKLRAKTDVYILERRVKELEGKVLSLEKDNAAVNLTIGETNAGKRKVRGNFVESEVLSETNANPGDSSSQRKKRDMSNQPLQHSYIDPGPIDPTVLHSQQAHRSNDIWYNQMDESTLACRRGGSNLLHHEIDARMIPILRQSGFYGVARLGSFHLDHHLITALVERWRPETHTFHLPEGEATITLQDVAIQTGLPINGRALVCSLPDKWDVECERLLGILPPRDCISNMYLKVRWLKDNFDVIPIDANEETIAQYTRAYLLQLISSALFCTKTTGSVSLMFLPFLEDVTKIGDYSWGAGCLAFLYRELCNATRPDTAQIGGPLFLLQLWAWDRLKVISPALPVGDILPDIPLGRRWSTSKTVNRIPTYSLLHIRYALDLADHDSFIWQPYTDEIRAALPDYCFKGRVLWLAVVPLICMHIVEWHQPDRVLRQFGYRQHIPSEPKQTNELHCIDLREIRRNLMTKQADWIFIWNHRANYTFAAGYSEARHDYYTEYPEWYKRITRRWISVRGASYGATVDGLEQMALVNDIDSIQRIRSRICDALREERRYVSMPPLRATPLSTYTSVDTDDNVDEEEPTNSTNRRRRRYSTVNTET